MASKARAGHVTGGRVFGYDNVEIHGPTGLRCHVTRRINDAEAAVVRRIFELCAAGYGVRTTSKLLNDAHQPAPRAQQGRPAGWSGASVWAVLRRPLYRGEIVWNRSRKRDVWGRTQQKARDESEWLRVSAPDLRIVPEDLWTAAHERLAGAREDYVKATGGRVWGRGANGTATVKYLLPGLAQCAVCGGGLLVHSRHMVAPARTSTCARATTTKDAASAGTEWRSRCH